MVTDGSKVHLTYDLKLVSGDYYIESTEDVAVGLLASATTISFSNGSATTTYNWNNADADALYRIRHQTSEWPR